MTTTDPTTVPVPCTHCRRDVHRTPAEWQAMADANEPPVCPACEIRRDCEAAKGLTRLGGMTVTDLVLKGLVIAHHRGVPEVPVEDLIVLSWKEDRTGRLALKGYPYPNSNRVIVELVKMLAKGLIERPAPNKYRVTAKGRKRLAGA